MNTAPTLPRRPAGAHAAPATAAADAAPGAAPGTAAPSGAAPTATAGPGIAPNPSALAPIDRAVLALGTALVSWSRRAERRGAAHPALPTEAAADATPIHATSPTSDGTERELHHLRRTAVTDRAIILAQRDLGANRLLR